MNSRLRVLAVFSFLTLVVATAIGTLAPRADAHTYSGSYVGPITFTNGDVLTAANLNQAITHVHNTFGNIVNAHISSSAAISHLKLANPALVPKAMALFNGGSSGSPSNYVSCTTTCTVSGDRVTSVIRSATGIYEVTLAYTPANAVFGVTVTPLQDVNHSCRAYDYQVAAPQFKIKCGAPVDAAAQFAVFDTD